MIKRTDNKSKSARETRPPTPSRTHRGNQMALATIASVVVSTMIGFKPLSPLLHAAAIAPFYYTAMKRHEHRFALVLVTRWGIVLFVTVLLIGVFAPGQTGASLPYADRLAESLRAWVADASASPPGGYPYMLWGMAAFLALSVASGGFLGFVVAATAVGSVAYGASVVFRHGYNLFQIGLLAVPPWQWCFLGSAVFLLIPAGLPVLGRYLGVTRRPEDLGPMKTYLRIGAGLLVLAFALRLTTAGVWRALLERWTVLGGP